ncbi:helix-turn-helix transcriptional regulator [Streptomyces sp. SP17BM10]|uniref:helix-turn-helix transcriptional regulator n=1 Tax=Streptomyces sp. SP17BM10 TaxID=3002530 RepID=UPI002E7886DE|nr:helix-turn-helix transcriptional regulator [Streptomyces sp. SP17BM10]MEE1786326.1 helix-turn-helix transcriptional regulator [Streptomyces sp. SP17BM10]
MPLPLVPSPTAVPVSARLRFGHRLRHWREVHGLSQAGLGRRLGYDDSLISRIENARRWPPPGLAARADELLGTGGELAGLWQSVQQEREHLGALGPLGTAGAADAARPDAAALDVQRRLLAVYRTALGHVGGEDLTAVLEHHTRTLAGWRQDAPVLSLAARYAELAGWAHFDGDRPARAHAWYGRGLAWARAAGDRAAVADLLARQSAVHWWSGDPTTALALAGAARAAALLLPARPGVQAWAALAAAHAHGRAGAAGDALRALADAERLTGIALRAGEPSPWLARAHLVLTVAHGTCHRDLAASLASPSHARTAAAHLSTALTQLPPSTHPHDHALVTARLATAHAHAGDPEAASALLAHLPPTPRGRTAHEARLARCLLSRAPAR